MNWFEEWEVENRVGLKNVGEEREATGTVKVAPKAEGKLFSRFQWKGRGRRVIVPDPQAKKIVTTRIGDHRLYLFSLEQTTERTD
jgi:hypothetical protein